MNITEQVCDRHRDRSGQVALYFENKAGVEQTYTFGRIKSLSDRLAKYRVRKAFIPPTALKMMRRIDDPKLFRKVNLRSIMSAGELATHRGDPVMFLEYWQNPDATRSKFIGDWYCTGDVGYRDGDGYLWFVGRKDDVISSAGYRIGPGEIEDCLLKHPAVQSAAVIGKPDALRGSIVKAFIVLWNVALAFDKSGHFGLPGIDKSSARRP